MIKKTARMVEDVIEAWDQDTLEDIKLDLRGTEFQKDVWKALLQIPKGQVIRAMSPLSGDRKHNGLWALRWVKIRSLSSFLVIVVQSSGGLGNYGWGVDLLEEGIS